MLQRPENNALDAVYRLLQDSEQQLTAVKIPKCTYLLAISKNYVQYASCSRIPRLLLLGTRLASCTVSDFP